MELKNSSQSYGKILKPNDRERCKHIAMSFDETEKKTFHSTTLLPLSSFCHKAQNMETLSYEHK